jgi:hypothetical protein
MVMTHVQTLFEKKPSPARIASATDVSSFTINTLSVTAARPNIDVLAWSSQMEMQS